MIRTRRFCSSTVYWLLPTAYCLLVGAGSVGRVGRVARANPVVARVDAEEARVGAFDRLEVLLVGRELLLGADDVVDAALDARRLRAEARQDARVDRVHPPEQLAREVRRLAQVQEPLAEFAHRLGRRAVGDVVGHLLAARLVAGGRAELREGDGDGVLDEPRVGPGLLQLIDDE